MVQQSSGGPQSRDPILDPSSGLLVLTSRPAACSGPRGLERTMEALQCCSVVFSIPPSSSRTSPGNTLSNNFLYIVGDAKLWWRTKYAEIQAHQVRLDMWALLQEAIREQFFPENVEYNAKLALQKLEHTGSVREYVKAFLALMLNIRDMLEKDKLFTFMEGLKPSACLELQRQRVTDLSSAMTAAERLTDFNPKTQRDRQMTPSPT
ncbi:UNVERIFIED_CONTAM: hypothetical protein Sindi_0932800 [Sesamum indicum]